VALVGGAIPITPLRRRVGLAAFVFQLVALLTVFQLAVGYALFLSAAHSGLTPVVTAVSLLNLALLAGLATLVYGLADQLEPKYPGVLNWLPLAGSMSAGLTVALLALLIAGGRAPAAPRRKRIGRAVFVTCAIAFVPFLDYWNLLGLAGR
jgi:hypothetical protein